MKNNLKKIIVNYELIFYLMYWQIYNFFYIKIKSFNSIIEYVKKPISGKWKGSYEINQIAKYHAKICKILMINQCLISAITLNNAFKKLGINSSIIIGITKSESFKSHAWVNTEHGDFLFDNKNTYKKILEIK